jgi:2-oxoglutarate ferredoxin oxidoreductase subunit delta
MAKGRIVIEEERCKGCDLCRSACPPDVIVLSSSLNSRGYRPAQLIENGKRCTGCALCAVICPEACITVYRSRSLGRGVVASSG